jgi:dihydrofolate synthase/folylpolyglutamate synthase
MTYPQALRYLDSFIDYEKFSFYLYKKSFKLERFRKFLDTIGRPQDYLRCIHIAGTKGKGSTAVFCAYILKEAGFKVGLYTSPHLTDLRERIRILNPGLQILQNRRRLECRFCLDFEGMISKRKLADLISRLKPSIDKFNHISKYGRLSFFEIYTALAFLYFKRERVDFAVLESGLGGRLDATNVAHSLVCAITPISYDHTQLLGQSIRKIAYEKVGIIKAQSPRAKAQNLIVISAPQTKAVLRIISKCCRQISAPLRLVGKDIIFREKGYNLHRQRFTILSSSGKYLNLKSRLLGRHQIINAATAVGIIEALKELGFSIGPKAISRGIFASRWPVRFQIIPQQPLVILDGSHNIGSVLALKQTYKQYFKNKKCILVFGVSEDKDIKGICKKLKEIVREVVLTKADNPRALAPEELKIFFKDKITYIIYPVEEALKKARIIAQGKASPILVTGSLFVAGRCYNIVKRKKALRNP